MLVKIQIFSAGCTESLDLIRRVEEMLDEKNELEVLDIGRPEVAELAANLGINRRPAVSVNGVLMPEHDE